MTFDKSLFFPILNHSIGSVRNNLGQYALALLIVSTSGFAADYAANYWPSTTVLFNFAYLIVSLYVEAWVIGIVLSGRSGGVEVRNRFPVGSFVVLGILTGLAMGLGALFLLLPAIYLAARWFIAAPMIIAENRSVTDAMQQSWDALVKHWFAAALLTVTFFAWRMSGLLIILPAERASLSGDILLLVWAVVNILAESSFILWSATSASMYILVIKPANEVTEIFG